MDYLETKSSYSLTNRQLIVLDIYKNLNKQNQHKMLPIPIYKK